MVDHPFFKTTINVIASTLNNDSYEPLMRCNLFDNELIGYVVYLEDIEKQDTCDAKFGLILRCIRGGVVAVIDSLRSNQTDSKLLLV